eukprot:jgi/Ulvmu1/2298/UM013_0145.1
MSCVLPCARPRAPAYVCNKAHVGLGWRTLGARRLQCHADKSKVLIIGGGGREHALAWKLGQSPSCDTLYCAPGNPGIAHESVVSDASHLNIDDHEQVASFCKEKGIDLVFVGPEAPLVDGIVDSLADAGVAAFGPTKAAAALEGSKSFMKDLCKKYSIPTAASETFTKVADAHSYIEQHGAPIVVKASGLAAGKGVIVAETVDEAKEAASAMLEGGQFGEAGSEIVIEDFLKGEEASFFALIDGSTVIPFGSAQDHKAIFNADKGPNTGGMGAYSPAPVLTPEIEAQVLKDIVQPVADAMVSEGAPFRGVLFAGLMIADGKAQALEFNVRFGDPEVQCLMMRLQSDLLPTLLAAAHGGLADAADTARNLDWTEQAALGVVMASEGYPGDYAKGTAIQGLEKVEGKDDVKVFHAGTAAGDGGEGIVASGGRVLCVTALGPSVQAAQLKAYDSVRDIEWPEGYYRTDIGWRAISREDPA